MVLVVFGVIGNKGVCWHWIGRRQSRYSEKFVEEYVASSLQHSSLIHLIQSPKSVKYQNINKYKTTYQLFQQIINYKSCMFRLKRIKRWKIKVNQKRIRIITAEIDEDRTIIRELLDDEREIEVVRWRVRRRRKKTKEDKDRIY